MSDKSNFKDELLKIYYCCPECASPIELICASSLTLIVSSKAFLKGALSVLFGSPFLQVGDQWPSFWYASLEKHIPNGWHYQLERFYGIDSQINEIEFIHNLINCFHWPILCSKHSLLGRHRSFRRPYRQESSFSLAIGFLFRQDGRSPTRFHHSRNRPIGETN